MKSIEVTAKTAEAAIEKGLIELNTTKENVDIEILDQGSKGFLNIFGVKEAVVKITLKKQFDKEAKEFLDKIFTHMGVEAKVETKETQESLNVEILGEDMGILIGYRGETLDALQYLTSLAINKDTNEKYKRVILDTQNYRAKRTEILKGLAIKKAKRAKMFNKAIKLEPMNPYERRIIHSALQNDNYVKTFSEGDEPYRRVVIEPKRKKA